ncbi:MAG: DUF922 domain-containing protein [Pseudomonadota bacterium]
MGASLRSRGAKVTYYTVAGESLPEIEEQIKKKGPKDPISGKRLAGVTKLRLSVALDRAEFEPAGKILEDEKTDLYACRGKVKKLEIGLSGVITLPRLQTKDLSKKARSEWERFAKDLRKHQTQHLAAAEAEINKVIVEIDEMRAEAQGVSTQEASDKAYAQLRRDLVERYRGNIDKRVEWAQQKFDNKNNYGPTLNTKIS